MEKLKNFIGYWCAVARLTEAQLCVVFTRLIHYFSGSDED